jgi:hypothetical protein
MEKELVKMLIILRDHCENQESCLNCGLKDIVCTRDCMEISDLETLQLDDNVIW